MAEVKDNLIQLEVVYSKLNKSIDENISRLTAGALAVDNYNKKISVIPSEFQKSLVDIKTKTDAVTISSKKLEQQSIKESNARNALNKQREQSINSLNKEQQQIQVNENAYRKAQVEMNKLNVSYQNLAVRQAQGATLTKAEAEQMVYLEKRIQGLDKTLKAVDASTGKFSRNVGNYSTAFNPMTSAVSRLAQEVPNLCFSSNDFCALFN